MSPGKTRFFYILYIVSVTTFFIYRLFPGEVVWSYLASRLKAAGPDFNLAIARARPTFPLGLQLEKMKISHKNMPIAEIAELNIRPDFGSLFSPGNALFFQGDLYSGTIRGRLDWVSKTSDHMVLMKSTLTGIQIGGNSALERLIGRKISGILTGTLQFESTKGGSGLVAAGLTIADLRVEIPASVFGLEHLAFKNMSADITAGGRNIRINSLTLRGDQIDGKLAGTLALNDPVNKSILNMSGSIRPHHQFLADLRKEFPVNLLSKKRTDNNEFPIRFAGTVDSPLVSMD